MIKLQNIRLSYRVIAVLLSIAHSNKVPAEPNFDSIQANPPTVAKVVARIVRPFLLRQRDLTLSPVLAPTVPRPAPCRAEDVPDVKQCKMLIVNVE
jgi:hypothetical protein